MKKIKVYEYYRTDNIHNQKLYLTACREMIEESGYMDLTGKVFEAEIPDDIGLGNFKDEEDIPYPTSLFDKNGMALEFVKKPNGAVYLVSSQFNSVISKIDIAPLEDVDEPIIEQPNIGRK